MTVQRGMVDCLVQADLGGSNNLRKGAYTRGVALRWIAFHDGKAGGHTVFKTGDVRGRHFIFPKHNTDGDDNNGSDNTFCKKITRLRRMGSTLHTFIVPLLPC